jgi:hypothetical protein
MSALAIAKHKRNAVSLLAQGAAEEATVGVMLNAALSIRHWSQIGENGLPTPTGRIASKFQALGMFSPSERSRYTRRKSKADDKVSDPATDANRQKAGKER